MDELKRIDLDKRAIVFATEMLTNGSAGSIMLIDALKHRAKSSWTLLPPHVNSNQLYQFSSGGICDIDTSEEQSKLVYNNLVSDDNSAWILIDNTREILDPMEKATISGITTPFHLENELFQLLNKHMISIESVRETIRLGGAYPSVGFLTKLNLRLFTKIKGHEISTEDMQIIVKGIYRIVIGAYDEEGYLTFELVSE